MKIKILPKYLMVFIISFIVFTPIGTLSHEYGHIAVAEYLGYETKLYYGSMTWDFGSISKEISELNSKYKEEIQAKVDFPEKEKLDQLWHIKKKHDLWITIGGPFQTIMVGCLGLFYLVYRKKIIKETGLKMLDWITVFLALFWFREVFNLVMSLASTILRGDWVFFNSSGDEIRISRSLGLYPGTVPIIMGTLGILVACYVIFKIIPKEIRLTFILGGLIGGSLGFVLWMDVVGPYLF